MRCMNTKRFANGQRVVTVIGEVEITGIVGPVSTFGPVSPRDYLTVRDDAGKNHLALLRNTRKAHA
jgi:hypothetical protein